MRVQFVVGDGESAGTSPAWMGPSTRLSELCHKSARGSMVSEGIAKDGNGAALVEGLKKLNCGIGDVEDKSMTEHKTLYKSCFGNLGCK